jgi:hypothetical protein
LIGQIGVTLSAFPQYKVVEKIRQGACSGSESGESRKRGTDIRWIDDDDEVERRKQPRK